LSKGKLKVNNGSAGSDNQTSYNSSIPTDLTKNQHG